MIKKRHAFDITNLMPLRSLFYTGMHHPVDMHGAEILDEEGDISDEEASIVNEDDR